MTKREYVGITYPGFLGFRQLRWLWKKLMCPRRCHLFDEVWSLWGTEDDPQWYLHCDACGFSVDLRGVRDD